MEEDESVEDEDEEGAWGKGAASRFTWIPSGTRSGDGARENVDRWVV